MLIAPLILAASLGQTCPQPPSRWGPPPCAASNVPGCLPGYHREVDASGRTIYRCDAYTYQPPAAQVAPPSPPPPFAEGGAPPAPPPPAWGSARSYAPYQRGLVGVVLMPGGVTADGGHTTHGAFGIGLELRPPTGGASFRLGYEYSDPVSVLDATFKYDFIDGPFSPFLGLGLGAAYIDPLAGTDFADPRVDDHTWRGAFAISGGVDVFFAPNVFATFEVKQRWYQTERADPTDLRSTGFMIGMGFFF